MNKPYVSVVPASKQRRNRFVAVTALVLLPFAVAGCASSSSSVVPYSLSSASPVASPQMPAFESVETSLTVLEPKTSYVKGDVIAVKLSWENTSKKKVEGSLEAAILAPTGLRILESSECTHSLTNDLVCRFDGELLPGGTSEKEIVYKVYEDVDLTDASLTLRTDVDSSQVPLTGK